MKANIILKVLPEIKFEGKTVKPSKNGFYRCPFNCHDDRYGAPKWKTEKGFQQHMQKCTGKPSFKTKIDEKTAANIAASQNVIDKFIIDHPIGSELIISTYDVTKPKYEQRGSRMVKVRYEEVRRYYAAKITINSLIPNSGHNPSFLINNTYWRGDITIFEDFEQAKIHAAECQRSYNKSCDEASLMRD